jgi:hypothetical protein
MQNRVIGPLTIDIDIYNVKTPSENVFVSLHETIDLF